jgi:hypothetical protein
MKYKGTTARDLSLPNANGDVARSLLYKIRKTKVSHFSKMCHCTRFQDLATNGATAVSCSEVFTTATLLSSLVYCTV